VKVSPCFWTVIRRTIAMRHHCLETLWANTYFMQWSFGLEHQIGEALHLRAQYVGTRAVNQPYLTEVNGYQTVTPGVRFLDSSAGRRRCGCFRAIP
jgi:hypothetical protein